jgi:plasmid stabilization system protein ParE
VSRPLAIDVSDLAKTQIRAAEDWWRLNRPKAPNAIREELERAASIISIQPSAGARALNVSLPDVRRVHLARVRYYLYYWLRIDPERIEILAFWHESRGSGPPL